MIQEIEENIAQIIKEQLEIQFSNLNKREWFDLKSAAAYAGVSYNTFMKFRELGLEVAEINGIKRVNKHEIDRFLQAHSF